MFQRHVITIRLAQEKVSTAMRLGLRFQYLYKIYAYNVDSPGNEVGKKVLCIRF